MTGLEKVLCDFIEAETNKCFVGVIHLKDIGQIPGTVRKYSDGIYTIRVAQPDKSGKSANVVDVYFCGDRLEALVKEADRPLIVPVQTQLDLFK